MNKTYRSIQILLNHLLAKKSISRDDFKRKLAEAGLPSSDSTITRILRRIDDELGVSIYHDCAMNTYVIDEESSDPDGHKNCTQLKHFCCNQSINKELQPNGMVADFLTMGNTQQDRQLSYLQEVTKGIVSQQKLQITYRSFSDEEPKTYLVAPLFLRVFDHRWYLIVADDIPDRNHFIFAFDRMLNMILSRETFEKPTFPTPGDFDHVYGVSYGKKVENVLLRFAHDQYRYLSTLPFHPTQKQEKVTEKGVEVSFQLVCNYELMMWILKQGAKVTVLKPQSLKNQIKEEIAKIQKAYR